MPAGALLVGGGSVLALEDELVSDALGTVCCCGGGNEPPDNCNDCADCPATFVVQIVGVVVKHHVLIGSCEFEQTVSYDLLYPVTRTTGIAPYPPSDTVCAWIDPGKIDGGTCPLGEETATVIDLVHVSGTAGCEDSLACGVDELFERVSGLLLTCNTFGGTPPKLGASYAPNFASCNPDDPGCGFLGQLPPTWLHPGVTILLDPCANTVLLPDVGAGIDLGGGKTLLSYGTWTIL